MISFQLCWSCKETGITHFEFGGGARFQSLFFYLQENAFEMMDKFRQIVGPDANLQTLLVVSTLLCLILAQRELIDLHAKCLQNMEQQQSETLDALNDVQNLEYSAECIKNMVWTMKLL